MLRPFDLSATGLGPLQIGGYPAVVLGGRRRTRLYYYIYPRARVIGVCIDLGVPMDWTHMGYPWNGPGSEQQVVQNGVLF